MFYNFNCFRVVVGNPPYIKEYTSREIFEHIKLSHLKKYYQGKMDLWYFFVCHGLDLLKSKGALSFIAPNNRITNAGASILRNKVLQESKITNYVDFGDFKVFADAGIQTMVFVLQKQNNIKKYKLIVSKVIDKKIKENELEMFLNNKASSENIQKIDCYISPNEMQNSTITFIDNKINIVIEKIRVKGNYILKDEDLAQGIVYPQDYLNKKNQQILGNEVGIGDGIFVLSNNEKLSLNLTDNENELINPAYTSKQLGRYFANPKNEEWVIYTDSSFKKASKIKQYPNIKKHLDKFKKVITSDNKPYGLHRAREEKFFMGEKIVSLRKCQNYPKFSYVDFNCYVSASFYIIKPLNIHLKYLTGLLNSKLITFWLLYKGKMQGDIYQIDKGPLLEIPLIKLDDVQQEKPLIDLVDNMLQLQKHFHESKSNQEKSVLEKQIQTLDKEIDKMVYQLYNLTEEEIQLIESSVS